MRRLMPSIPMILILGGCATPGEKTAIGAGAGRVSILTDMAIAAESIDEAKGEEARQWAEARLREKLSSAEITSTNAARVRSLAQLRVKRRRRA